MEHFINSKFVSQFKHGFYTFSTRNFCMLITYFIPKRKSGWFNGFIERWGVIWKRNVGKSLKPLSVALLKLVGMEERMLHKPEELSGGQKQRTAIARAMANDPSIILAEEPTGALDCETSRKVMDIFHKLHRYLLQSPMMIVALESCWDSALVRWRHLFLGIQLRHRWQLLLWRFYSRWLWEYFLDIIRQTRRQSWIPSKHYDMNKERR